jgi:hypothetical protein
LLFDIEKSALLDVWGGLQELYRRSRPTYIMLKEDIIKATAPVVGVDNTSNYKARPPPPPPPPQQQQHHHQRKVG